MDATLRGKTINFLVVTIGILVGVSAHVERSDDLLSNACAAILAVIVLPLVCTLVKYVNVRITFLSSFHFAVLRIFVAFTLGGMIGRLTHEVYSSTIGQKSFYITDQLPIVGMLIGVFIWSKLPPQKNKPLTK